MTGAEGTTLVFVALGTVLGIVAALHEKEKKKRDDYEWGDLVSKSWIRRHSKGTWATVIALTLGLAGTIITTIQSGQDREDERRDQEMAKAVEDSLNIKIREIEEKRIEELRSKVELLNDTLGGVSQAERERFVKNLSRQDTLLLGLMVGAEATYSAQGMIDWLQRDRLEEKFSLTNVAFETSFTYLRKDCPIDFHATAQSFGATSPAFLTYEDGSITYRLTRPELVALRKHHPQFYELFLDHPIFMEMMNRDDSTHAYHFSFLSVPDKVWIDVYPDTVEIRQRTTGQFTIEGKYPEHTPSIFCMENADFKIKLDSGKDPLPICNYQHDRSFTFLFGNGWGINFINAKEILSEYPEGDLLGGKCLWHSGHPDIMNYLTFFDKKPITRNL